MKHCVNCNAEMRDDMQYCLKCGVANFTPKEKPAWQKKLSALFNIIMYPLLFFFCQYAVTIAIAFVVSFYTAFKYSALSEEALTLLVTETLNANMTAITLAANLIFLWAALLYYTLTTKHPFKAVNAVKFEAKAIPLGILLGFSLQHMVQLIIALIPWSDKIVEQFVEASPNVENTSLILQIISIAVVTGITEELVFRSLPITKAHPALGSVATVLLTSIVFGLAHGSIIAFVYTFIVGVVLALVFLRHRSLWPAAIIHISFNLASIVGLPTNAPIIIVAVRFISVALVAVSLYFILRKSTVSAGDDTSGAQD